MKTIIAGSLSLFAVCIASPALADDSPTSLSFSTGVDYTSGDYGTGSKTEILVVPVSARLKTGNVRFTATVPYLHIKGASNIVGGGDGGPIIIDPNSPRTTRSGIGDVTLGVNYALPEERLGFGLDLGARVKVPVASARKGLGTGKADAGVSAELSKTFGPVTPFVSGGYRFVGSPDGFNLHNAAFGSAGLSAVVGKAVLIGSYDYRESSSDLSRDSQELFGAVSGPVSDRLNFTLYGSAGLSKGAPDYGVGMIVTIKAF